MKVLFISILSLFLLSSCGLSTLRENGEGETPTDTSEMISALLPPKEPPVEHSPMGDPTNVDLEANPYFPNIDLQDIEFSGHFSFNEEPIKKDVQLHYRKVTDDVNLYKLSLDQIDGVPDDRLFLGYFYVTSNQIYRVNDYDLDEGNFAFLDDLSESSVIVCSDKDIGNQMAPEEKGWHQSISVVDGKSEYHSYNNQTESGFYETFVWEKGKGLVVYRSGFGAERDSIDIEQK